MNTPEQAQAWSRPPDPVDTMAHMNSDLDDLGNLFEFGDINLDPIPSVDSAHFDGTHPNTPFDEMNEAQAMGGTSAQDFGAHAGYGMSQGMEHHQQHRFNGQPQTSHPYAPDAMYQPSVHQQQASFHANQQYQFQSMHGYPSTQHIPPTPNSFDMHGETRRFLQQQLDPHQRAILEQRYQLKKEDAIAFTPMVSPAGTPQYSIQPEFTIPGAYFSPLTSPMLHAQNGQQHHQGYYTNPSTAPSSSATSPLDPNADIDMLGDDISLPESANLAAKKSRRKTATPRSVGPLARVRQSPIQKPLDRKGGMKRKSGTMLSSLAPTKEMEHILEIQRSASTQPPSGNLQTPRNDSSDNGSISPEPLSEALMGPPPKPGSSLGQSPALAAQKDGPQQMPGKAATPKSLLSMRGGHQANPTSHPEQRPSSGTSDTADFEELQLPAAATQDPGPRPSLPQLDTRISSSTASDDTPRATARKTPKLGASSTPSSARAPSAMPSPLVMGSPMTASTPGNLLKDRKTDPKNARGNKKRGSMSGSGSALVSPALRPRISPSIKPLLPEGASLQSPTHALLLASKSNYQNLLEGNHLPGVHYPDSLSTGLTSKRTSHKVAEQGRRNRINEALKEMQSLLPNTASTKASKDASNSDESPEANGDGEGKESKEDAQGKSNSSKAATVESANEYIRKLQKENALLLQMKKEHDEMKRKLEEQTHSAPSTERSSASAVGSVSPAAA